MVFGIGTLLNAAGILIGGVLGLTIGRQLSLARQKLIKSILGILIVYVGLKMTWDSIHGGFGSALGQVGIVLLALVLGNVIGKLLRIQKGINRLGEIAKDRFSKADSNSPNRVSEGFITCTLLFCVGPMAILGSISDGLHGKWQTLAIKAVMDGLATMAFATTFGWGVILSLIPVMAYQGTITLLAHRLEPLLQNYAMVDALNGTGGLLVAMISLIVLDVGRVRIGDYLPSLAVAPFLAWVFGR